MTATTIKEIAEIEGRNKNNTLYKHMQGLKNDGLVKQGAKSERSNAYYLSEKGLNLLKNYENMEERTDGE